jgi:two-component system NtrC family sensor kinase
MHPLTAVHARLSSLVKKYKERHFEYIGYKEFADLMRTLESIGNQINYCYTTTERLVELNRKRMKLPKRRCHANMVIREIMHLKSNEVKLKDIRCRVRLDERIPLVAMGDIEFKQVLVNLIANAIQAMPGGGDLLVRTYFHSSEKRVHLLVQDTGVGISEEDMPHIFEPFFTTRHGSVERSIGLGLSIADSLLKDCQGTIRVESNLRKGTLVRITLPPAQKRSEEK